ncbi:MULTISPECIES: excinuclease ABC subunit UvrC [Fusobacterium]|uniref:excinuclease ABC subunit UvrC n=1 Tax=Fusobacterium TaxID=848 RepID=UPI0025B8126C|nr:excinuclease ABC subunit UvrC [Fusobacterium sp.]MCI7223475.1 excinuclease ABC subunit UvrC [Fusobacterium sp.]MDD7411347.1 excinuclease ABC subunit UvrC [Fusobacteriaceae bacterium]MDY5713701.1 excinuclease ABC subunit UvrC [Fusobacterium gastrosuis]
MDIGKFNIPETPGVYLMKKNSKVIYVGKAKNLKNRVSSYFNKNHDNLKTNELVKNIEDIEFFITNTEVDALLLENNLIKKYNPKYNILLKDEKTYPFIKISKEEFPSIKIIRTTKALDLKNGEYFGPYPYGAWKLKNIFMKLFKIRDCNRDMKKISSRPCLKYYMKSCTAPCVYKNIKEEYSTEVESLKEILRGNTSKIVNDLKEKMNISSRNMDFEKSIVYREQIRELNNIQSSQLIQYGRELDEDIFVFKIIVDKVFICVLNMRDGKILGKLSTTIDLKNKFTDNLYEAIFMSYYSKHMLPKSIVLDNQYENEFEIVKKALEEQNLTKREFHFPKIKSRRKELLDMAYKNLERDLESYYSKKDSIEKGIKELYYTLGLKRFPLKVECFDISNIQGKDAVASMSVSVEGRPAKKEYRKFKIQCKDTPDDFSMMREVIERRYTKLDSKDFPDVILIDGGLGQINSAGEVLERIGKAGIADLLSLAKRDEEIYKYGEVTPYSLSKDSEALKMFQRVRDEAHRFGITYHRKLRSKRIISSELDKIDGIGTVRKKALFERFGSISAIKVATFEELSEVVPKNIAEKIKNNLR